MRAIAACNPHRDRDSAPYMSESMMKLPAIPPLDRVAETAARERQNTLTKPPGSLGRLEELALRLAAITGQARPRVNRKAVIVMAADHGVCAEGVSAFPPEVTPQMVANFLNGGAAINVLARQADARVIVVDIGVAADIPARSGLVARKIARGTKNMAAGPAMTRDEAMRAIQCGIDVANEQIDAGLDVLATGDMGIGNTTPSAALIAVLTAISVAKVTGRGTGIDDAGLARKISVIERAIALNKPDARDPLDVLAKVGGLEIAGLAGVMICGASRRVPVVIDGFISGAAALVATRLAPAVKDFLIASHQSVEAGHRVVLEDLGLRPLLNLDLRLGEGTGAALAFHLLEAAARIQNEMATFGEAGVSNKS
jgi:nicotinate-nucleotide--dimethylbenzimidazole phosphoribosyltransferase